MERHRLNDAQWERIASVVPGKVGDPGRHGEDNRLFVDAVLWICRTGAPWRDLSAEFGEWNSVWRRFPRWAKRGVWSRILEHVSDDPDLEYVIIDATIVRTHQYSGGGKGAPSSSGNEPTLLTELDHHYQSAILVKGGEGSTHIVCTGCHGASPSALTAMRMPRPCRLPHRYDESWMAA